MYLRRAALLALLAAVATLLVGFGTASAHKAAYPTRVVIQGGGPEGAHGVIKSKQAGCLEGREVRLYVKGMGGRLILVGATTTDSGGNWTIEAELFAGQYVAKVTADETTVHGNPHRCKRGRSGAKRL